MSRIGPVHWKTLARVFELDGFTLVRTRGDHLVYTKADIPRPIVIPKYDALPVFIIKNNLRSAKISRERYFELLSRAG